MLEGSGVELFDQDGRNRGSLLLCALIYNTFGFSQLLSMFSTESLTVRSSNDQALCLSDLEHSSFKLSYISAPDCLSLSQQRESKKPNRSKHHHDGSLIHRNPTTLDGDGQRLFSEPLRGEDIEWVASPDSKRGKNRFCKCLLTKPESSPYLRLSLYA
jgi:hypothetical protein